MCKAGASPPGAAGPASMARASQPGSSWPGCEPRRLPDGHRLEVRAVRVGITDRLHDRQPALFAELRETAERRMQPDVIVDRLQVLGLERELGPALVVDVVAVGDDGVEAVVAPVELDDDEDPSVGIALRAVGQGERGAGQEGRYGRAAGQERRASQAQAEQFASGRRHGRSSLSFVRRAGIPGNGALAGGPCAGRARLPSRPAARIRSLASVARSS